MQAWGRCIRRGHAVIIKHEQQTVSNPLNFTKSNL